MKIFKNNYFLLVLLFLLLLIDGQLSFVMSSIFSYHWTISSHLFLLASLYFYYDKKNIFILMSSMILGIVFDIYYLNMIGLVVFLLPILILLAGKVSKIFFESSFRTLVLFVTVVFTFETVGYFISEFFRMTSITLIHFATYNLAFSLCFNIFIFIISHKILKKIFLKPSLT